MRGGDWLCIPLGEEVDCGCLAKGLPLLCEVVFVLPRWRLYWLREEFGTPGYCIAPKSSVEVPCVGVLGGQVSGLEILLCEGGDVELCARTLKYILVFAFDPLSLTLSLLYCAYCSYHIYTWGLFVCHTCVKSRASYSTSTLI